MFRPATGHHQGVRVFLVRITELKCEYSYVAMWWRGSIAHFTYMWCLVWWGVQTPPIDLGIIYANTLISKVYDTKFLGIYVYSTLSWKHRVKRITHKLSAACYGLQSVKPFISQETLEVVYYPFFHSIMNYELILWGNSSWWAKIFQIQKNRIRIIKECRSRGSCRDLFKIKKILPLQLQYTYYFSYLWLTTKINSN
jgi:hypothetical protein